MRFFVVLSLLSLCFADQASEKVAKLNELSNNGNNVIALDENSFTMFTQGPRSYSLFVVLTALNPQFQCAPCKLIQKELEYLPYSAAKSLENGRFYVAYLDFSKSSEKIFAQMKLQNVPHLMIYHPTSGPHAKGNDFDVLTLSGEDDGKVHGLAKMINKKTGLSIKITKPIDWNFYLSALTALSSGIALLTVIYYNFSSIFDFSKMGANLVILFTAFMCSGYMWNTIRHPPFLGVGDRGETQVFSGSQQHQFGIEPLVMTVLYCSASLVFGLLFGLVPHIPNPTVQRYTAYICVALFYVIYSVILRVFRIKSGGYPFKLLF